MPSVLKATSAATLAAAAHAIGFSTATPTEAANSDNIQHFHLVSVSAPRLRCARREHQTNALQLPVVSVGFRYGGFTICILFL